MNDSPTSQSPETQSYSLSDRGLARRNNEDAAAYFEPADPLERAASGCVYIVADGVGGAAMGERASRFAAQKVLYEYYQRDDPDPGRRLQDIIQQVNGDIHYYAQDHETRMATTIVVAVVRGGTLHLANVGDSRAYLIRGGHATQLTRDHSYVGEKVTHENMSEEQARRTTAKDKLTRSVGGESAVHVELYPARPLEPRDRLLLCTDGLTRYVSEPARIAELIGQAPLKDSAHRLVRYALDSGGDDNISVMLISYLGGEQSVSVEPAGRPHLPSFEEPTRPEIRGWGLMTRKQRAALVRLGFAAIALLGVASWLVFSSRFLSTRTSQADPTPTMRQPGEPALGSALPAPAESEASAAGDTLEATALPTAAEVAATALVPTPTPESAAPPASQPAQIQYLCLDEVRSDEGLGSVLARFGQSYDQAGRYESCSLPDHAQQSCMNKELIADHGVIWAGSWVIVPGLVDRTLCEEKGGRWYQDLTR